MCAPSDLGLHQRFVGGTHDRQDLHNSSTGGAEGAARSRGSSAGMPHLRAAHRVPALPEAGLASLRLGVASLAAALPSCLLSVVVDGVWVGRIAIELIEGRDESLAAGVGRGAEQGLHVAGQAALLVGIAGLGALLAGRLRLAVSERAPEQHAQALGRPLGVKEGARAERIVIEAIKTMTLPPKAIYRARAELARRLDVPDADVVGAKRRRLETRLNRRTQLYGWGQASADDYRRDTAETHTLLAELPDRDKLVAFDRNRRLMVTMAENVEKATRPQLAELV